MPLFLEVTLGVDILLGGSAQFVLAPGSSHLIVLSALEHGPEHEEESLDLKAKLPMLTGGKTSSFKWRGYDKWSNPVPFSLTEQVISIEPAPLQVCLTAAGKAESESEGGDIYGGVLEMTPSLASSEMALRITSLDGNVILYDGTHPVQLPDPVASPKKVVKKATTKTKKVSGGLKGSPAKPDYL